MNQGTTNIFHYSYTLCSIHVENDIGKPLHGHFEWSYLSLTLLLFSKLLVLYKYK